MTSVVEFSFLVHTYSNLVFSQDIPYLLHYKPRFVYFSTHWFLSDHAHYYLLKLAMKKNQTSAVRLLKCCKRKIYLWTSVNLNLSLLSKGTNSTTDVGCCWRYLQGLSELIWEYQNTTQGRRTLDSYMKWHVIKFARSALSEPYRDAGKILEKVFVPSIGLAKDKIPTAKYLLT